MSELRNYSYDEAAELLRCGKRWLQDNIARLPHQKFGRSTAFSAEDLAEIRRMHAVRPEPEQDAQAAEAAHLTLATIAPSARARRSS